VPRPGEDLVHALARDVEGAAEFALVGPCLVRSEHGLTEGLPCTVEALEGLVGGPKPADDLPEFGLVAHSAMILDVWAGSTCTGCL
jgi:hypothetical protein